MQRQQRDYGSSWRKMAERIDIDRGAKETEWWKKDWLDVYMKILVNSSETMLLKL